ncbi:MAG: hypothetical protein WDN04_11410 [Rhodospirillales bacterium]
MRGVLVGLGAVFALLLLGGVGLGVWTFASFEHGEQSAQDYVDAAVPAITARWDVDELTTRAEPALLRGTDSAKLKLLFVWLSTLGPLQDYRGAALQSSSVQSMTGSLTVSTAHYVAKARYVHGDARIDIVVVRHDAGWHILGFHVNSEGLQPQLPAQRL